MGYGDGYAKFLKDNSFITKVLDERGYSKDDWVGLDSYFKPLYEKKKFLRIFPYTSFKGGVGVFVSGIEKRISVIRTDSNAEVSGTLETYKENGENWNEETFNLMLEDMEE